MLGKINASPTVHYALFCSTLQGFWIPRNLAVEKSRFETRLNGGSSLGFSWYSPNTNTVNRNFSHKLCCISSSGNTDFTENNPVPNRMAPRQLLLFS
jgi:hypothetical protein